MYYLIIGRDCPHLQQELVSALSGRKDIQVLLNRRYGERRTTRRPIPKERRRKARRKMVSPMSSG